MSSIDPIDPIKKPIRNHEIIQNLIETPSLINGLHNRLSSIVGKVFLNISHVFYDFQSSERLITGRPTPDLPNTKNARRVNPKVNDAAKRALDSLSSYKESLKTSPTLVNRVHLLHPAS